MSPIFAFTPEQAARVANIPRRQLDDWARSGFFCPSYTRDTSRFARMYSFRDAVALRALATVRKQLPRQELTRIRDWLRERYDEPWDELKFFVIARRVEFDLTTAGNHAASAIELAAIEREAEKEAARLRSRDSEQIGRIVRQRNVQHNAWLVDGTRIPTRAIWDFHVAGYGVEEIQREYPQLLPPDIEAAISFEAHRQRKAS